MSKDHMIVEGKTYISVSRASEITSYSNDYIGQLCRGKKIDSVRVSRSWFVDEVSLLAHKSTSKDKLQNHYKSLSRNLASGKIEKTMVKVEEPIVTPEPLVIPEDEFLNQIKKSVKFLIVKREYNDEDLLDSDASAAPTSSEIINRNKGISSISDLFTPNPAYGIFVLVFFIVGVSVFAYTLISSNPAIAAVGNNGLDSLASIIDSNTSTIKDIFCKP